MTRNTADFHGYTFSHEANPQGIAIYASHPEHSNVGFLYLHHHNGKNVVLGVSVNEPHRRKGVATGMWNYAKANGFDPVHDKEPSQTELGKKWAKAVGE